MKFDEAYKKHKPNKTEITPFRCPDCGYRHSDEVIEISNTSHRASWQKVGGVYCSRCGKEVEHINISEK